MLRITIDLIPFGVEKDKTKIGEMIITNVGRSGEGHNYVGHFIDNKGNEYFGLQENHDRSKQVLELVRLMTETMLLEDNGNMSEVYKNFAKVFKNKKNKLAKKLARDK